MESTGNKVMAQVFLSLIINGPFLLACLGGLVFMFSRWRRQPVAAAWAVGGLLMIFLASFAGALATPIMLGLFPSEAQRMSKTLFPFMTFVLRIVEAGGLALLLAAIGTLFPGKPAAPPAPGA